MVKNNIFSSVHFSHDSTKQMDKRILRVHLVACTRIGLCYSGGPTSSVICNAPVNVREFQLRLHRREVTLTVKKVSIVLMTVWAEVGINLCKCHPHGIFEVLTTQLPPQENVTKCHAGPRDERRAFCERSKQV